MESTDAAASAATEVLREWQSVMSGDPEILTLAIGPKPGEVSGVVGARLVIPVDETLLDLLLPGRGGAFGG